MQFQTSFPRIRATICVLASLLAMNSTAQASKVLFDTVLGSFEVELFDDDTPITVANFLSYVEDGDYNGTIIHRRSTAGSSGVEVVQGGGFTYDDATHTVDHVPSDGNIANEFLHSNVRGTIALARTGGPGTGSNQWYFNLVDGNSVLDSQEFTVFGQVLDNGMDIVDAIAALTIMDLGSPFNEIPLLNDGANLLAGQPLNDLVFVNSITLIDEPLMAAESPAVANPEPAAVVLATLALLGFLYYARVQTRSAKRLA
jgi:cyclophilin family peptidyl-prolyl cis-trans isomerase